MLRKLFKPPYRLMIILIIIVISIILVDHLFMQPLDTFPRGNRLDGDYRLDQKDEKRIENFAEIKVIPGDSRGPDEDGGIYKEEDENKPDGSNESGKDEEDVYHLEYDPGIGFENSLQDKPETGNSLFYDKDEHYEGKSQLGQFENDPVLGAPKQSEHDTGKGEEGGARSGEVEERKEVENEQRPVMGGRKRQRRKGKEGEVLDDFSGQWNISSELRRLAPVVFKFVPPTFQSDYQGFCWYNAEHEFRCLPYFYLLGMPKCGTTDIWDHIVDHPYIVRVLKEPHWWTRSNRNLARVYISRSKSTIKLMEKRPASAIHYVLGDGSASYLWDMKRWQEYFDPDDPTKQLFLPHVIKTVTPKAKLIAAFREPVARLYSEYVYFSANPSPESFHERVVQRIQHFQNCTKEHSERKCVYQIAMENGDIRPMVGIYSVFARDWLEVFPREQMLFVRLEDWHLHCEDYLPKIYAFLDVETLPDTSIKKTCRIKSRNSNDKKKTEVGPILEKTKTLLREFYTRWNEDLAELLQDDRWLWDDVM